MAEVQNLYVDWTNRAISDSLAIKKYPQKGFSQKEIDHFYTVLKSFEKIILSFPKLYPQSTKNKKVLSAVLSKELSVFYKLSKDNITVLAVLDNRVGYAKWP